MASLNARDIAIDRTHALMACDIAQLEDLVATSREDVEALIDLQNELRYRQSPQALALLNQIQNIVAAREPQLTGSRFGGRPDRSARCST